MMMMIMMMIIIITELEEKEGERLLHIASTVLLTKLQTNYQKLRQKQACRKILLSFSLFFLRNDGNFEVRIVPVM